VDIFTKTKRKNGERVETRSDDAEAEEKDKVLRFEFGRLSKSEDGLSLATSFSVSLDNFMAALIVITEIGLFFLTAGFIPCCLR
jgi:hypothetical protein